MPMSDVTQILSALSQGDPHAAEKLLPLVYDELRQLAAQKLAQEKPGQTLQATALVHEAYLRLVGSGDASAPRDQHWNSRGHFFAAAAEAMRRILVDAARGKHSLKRGAGRHRQPLDEARLVAPRAEDDILAVDEALGRLAVTDAEAAEFVKLRFFAGLTSEQAAAALGVSARTGDRIWRYARAFLLKELRNAGG
jgi:RNA polymerase sigma factor (TIGR02999 family)